MAKADHFNAEGVCQQITSAQPFRVGRYSQMTTDNQFRVGGHSQMTADTHFSAKGVFE